MKVYALDRQIVNARFRLGQPREDSRRALFHGIAQSGIVNDFEDVAQVAVMMLVRDAYLGPRGADAGAVYDAEPNLVAAQAQKRKLLGKQALFDPCAYK